MKVTVLGMKASKGMMENGVTYDSTKVFTQVRLDDSKGTAKGFSGGDYTFGDSSVFEKYKHLTFPLLAEVEFDQVTSGKLVRQIIVSLQPLQIAKTEAKA
ncbi:hypothetical protein [Undibacterium oligocarboniphilum]|uniref:Single-stranded DNA-binding protein n=1 Tax=Undibacterium oligocarboniphilum TaxID=666702 RepID=A0A850QP86_9BURK|nr:hypothetical protein [Undibacterium oligocarboniphilum]MBC3871921.1 hypothetical protein [Undibacterium oligocarboniphilum]NVO79495.1 hypothetical protein [Undibacterium oligocarboniphilum]